MQELVCDCLRTVQEAACIIPCHLHYDGYLDSCTGGWNFLYRSNGWVLHHFMFAYHSYLYSHQWTTTLLWVYLWRTCELLIYLIAGISTLTVQHPNQLGTMIDHCDVVNASHLSFSYQTNADITAMYPYRFGDSHVRLFDHHHDNYLPMHLRNASFVNDHWPREPFPFSLSDVLLREFSFAMLAIIVGWIHVYLFATPCDKDSFRITSFFADYHYYDTRSEKLEYYEDNVRGLRKQVEHNTISQIHHVTTTTIKEDHRWIYEKVGFMTRNGLWPPSAWFGWRHGEFWSFRRIYWYHLIQMALLGTPAGILLGLYVPSVGTNAGLILYLFFVTALLVVYYHWNTAMYVYRHEKSVFRCRELYLFWILTLWVAVSCYTITSVERFFRLLIASGIVIIVTLLYYGISRAVMYKKHVKKI